MQPYPAFADVGLAFARALVAGDFEAAHRLLTPELASESSVNDLQTYYDSMVNYWDGPPDTVEVGQVLDPLTPSVVPEELGWVYVNIDRLNGPGGAFMEGVAVVVVMRPSGPAISQVVWGRP